MAQLVLGMGMAHSPMVILEDTLWKDYAEQLDYTSPLLIDTTGKPVTYEQLVEQVGDRFAQQATTEVWKLQYAAARQAVARQAADVATAQLDVLVVIGDDQLELFSYANMPALSIYYGDRLLSGIIPERYRVTQAIWQGIAKGYAM